MAENLWPALALLSLCVAIVATFCFLWHFERMFQHLLPEKRKFAPFAGPLILLLPFFDEAGNKHRIKFLLWTIIFGIAFAAVAMIKSFLG